MSDQSWILCLVIVFILYKLYVWQQVMDNQKSYQPPSPPPPQTTTPSSPQPDHTKIGPFSPGLIYM